MSSPSGPKERFRRALPAVLLFLLSLSACEWSLARNRQLGYMGGLADNWYALGVNLRSTLVFGEGREPTLFKPPGYPFFIASVLLFTPAPERTSRASDFPPGSELAGLATPFEEAGLLRGARAVFQAQAVLLAASAALLYLWLFPFLSFRPAFLAGLLLGTNPYTVLLAGLLNYSVVHLFLLILSCFCLEGALGKGEPRGRRIFLAGVLWSLCTLVRPVTLILPPFVGVLFFLRSPNGKEALRGFGLFLLGMALVLLPWTARNYALSGRLVPVNAQAWKNIWAGTVKPVDIDPNHFRYKWLRDEAIAIESRVAGPGRRVGWEPLGIRENLALEDRFEAEARKNIRKTPSIYLRNAWRSFWTFATDLNTILLSVFSYIQEKPDDEIQQNWFAPTSQRRFPPPGRGPLRVDWFFEGLGLLALLGLFLGLARKATYLLVPGLVFLCLAVAHSVTWMDLMYYYVKVPFLIVFAVSFLHEAEGLPSRIARASARLAEVVLYAASLLFALAPLG